MNKDLHNRFNKAFEKMPLVAILRGVLPENVCAIADVLIQSGFTLIEIPLNSPSPFKSIELLRQHCPMEVLVGAGTVLNPEDVKKLADIKAELIVTPNMDEDVLKEINNHDLISMIGCFSPSEAFKALKLGATAIKIFPVGNLGASYVKNIKAVLPSKVKVLAVGGVGTSNMEEFYTNQTDGFGLGNSLFNQNMTLDDIKKSAIDFVNTYKQLL